jgi:hypothetical protein
LSPDGTSPSSSRSRHASRDGRAAPLPLQRQLFRPAPRSWSPPRQGRSSTSTTSSPTLRVAPPVADPSSAAVDPSLAGADYSPAVVHNVSPSRPAQPPRFSMTGSPAIPRGANADGVGPVPRDISFTPRPHPVEEISTEELNTLIENPRVLRSSRRARAGERRLPLDSTSHGPSMSSPRSSYSSSLAAVAPTRDVRPGFDVPAQARIPPGSPGQRKILQRLQQFSRAAQKGKAAKK